MYCDISAQAPTGSATPLNPMAIAHAVAGATGSSGMSGKSVSDYADIVLQKYTLVQLFIGKRPITGTKSTLPLSLYKELMTRPPI